MKNFSRPEAKNTRALNLLKSWMSAIAIPYRPGTGGADVLVTGKNGTEVQVQISAVDSPKAPAGAVVIKAEVLTGRNIKGARDVFQGFVEMLGYTYRAPVDRGALPTKKVYFDDDFESGALRHADLHRVPNPSSRELAALEPVIKRETRRFYNDFRELCDDNMLGIDDLLSYGGMFTVAYLGMDRVEELNEGDNARKLSAHLKQRFHHLRDLLWKKGRNTFANLDEVHIALHGEPFDYSMTFSGLRRERAANALAGEGDNGAVSMAETFLRTAVVRADADEEEVDHDYLARRNQLDTSSEAARKRSASALLSKLLKGLPHDEMVERLKGVIDSDRLDPTARKEARRQIRVHADECEDCAKLLAPEETEEGADVESACLAE